jgi:hypothetical protein
MEFPLGDLILHQEPLPLFKVKNLEERREMPTTLEEKKQKLLLAIDVSKIRPTKQRSAYSDPELKEFIRAIFDQEPVLGHKSDRVNQLLTLLAPHIKSI